MHTPQWVGLCGSTQVLIVYMSVNLSGIQVVVAQHFLKGTHIDAVLKHQSSRRVPQLVGGILGTVQSGGCQVLLYQLVNRRSRDALPVLEGDKQSILVHQCKRIPFCEPVL